MSEKKFFAIAKSVFFSLVNRGILIFAHRKMCFKIPQFSVIYLSEALPPQPLDKS